MDEAVDEVKFWKNSAEFWRAKYEREIRKAEYHQNMEECEHKGWTARCPFVVGHWNLGETKEGQRPETCMFAIGHPGNHSNGEPK